MKKSLTTGFKSQNDFEMKIKKVLLFKDNQKKRCY